MQVINVPNVHRALPEGLRMLDVYGIKQESRNGDVIRAPGPVATVYHQPLQRVIFWEERDANPFLHFMEALWMLAGREDVKFLANYAKNMLQFSDDGVRLHGAYGHRWMTRFGFDQLELICAQLTENPRDRRNVLQMWKPDIDLGREGKDVPCNTHIYFDALDGELNMTVCCRSNDMIWGAYGANAVHFSFLLEYMAARTGLKVGRYIQISNNFHAYDNELLERIAPLVNFCDDGMGSAMLTDPYRVVKDMDQHFPLISTEPVHWMQDLKMFLDAGPTPGLRDPFFRRVAVPIWLAWEIWKKRDVDWYAQAVETLSNCKALDWKLVCLEWLDRRRAKLEQKERANDSLWCLCDHYSTAS
jgi:hypothetical protein